ncbi:dephospho-CoA kinase [Flaviflexus ciconiae]|uniref:Dephospho-CoA kinase n=1 Tax=Flaviflexus ciconiae TaxID=2496867 RepID=A0A3Q9G3J5_9ACTO|nr:dephospho-CoA kinase [Flaviflexus ciconiae]AZQ76619.1 dephospho-CoA kinase [Flaviflexus ciconiae]
MLYVGLTGGIASGKSLVSARMAEAGMKVMDADEISRDLTSEGGAAVPAIGNTFQGMVQNGILDRQKLANMVFSDPERLGELNAIIHPMVRDRMAEMFREYVSADPRAIVVEDSPLLIETGRAYVPQFLIVITSPDNLRIERLVRDRGMTEQHAQARINTQLEDEERLPFADAVIENTGTVEELEAQVDKIIARLREFEENVVTEAVPEAKGRHVMNGERLLGKLAHTGTEARVDGMDVVVPADTEEMILRHVCCVPDGDGWVRPDAEALVQVRLEETR